MLLWHSPKKIKPKGITSIVISSNDVENYPADHPDLMRKLALEKDFSFPYLYDENQSVATAYVAACTPDFYLLNTANKLVYRGRFDASRPGNEIPITGKDLQQAIDAMLKKTPYQKNNIPVWGVILNGKQGMNLLVSLFKIH